MHLIVRNDTQIGKRKDIEFVVGDQVLIKVSPWKEVLRFGKKVKLSQRFIGPQYRSDPSHVISYSEVELQSDLTYFEEPVKILA
ncbi:DNA/RNA polymerases superfamily protein [Gossypium australe]|uniref:DNA/RNA polymerases superfamily protein n=1 Tax=Gossypium australe TaxID=47621 RepID=A0A5B6WPU6_9ROSI|nr:DNA/RNA polymerases superfamily protein [Gossypium australe]